MSFKIRIKVQKAIYVYISDHCAFRSRRFTMSKIIKRTTSVVSDQPLSMKVVDSNKAKKQE